MLSQFTTRKAEALQYNLNARPKDILLPEGQSTLVKPTEPKISILRNPNSEKPAERTRKSVHKLPKVPKLKLVPVADYDATNEVIINSPVADNVEDKDLLEFEYLAIEKQPGTIADAQKNILIDKSVLNRKLSLQLEIANNDCTITCIALHPIQLLLISGSSDGTVRFWSTNSAELAFSPLVLENGHMGSINSLAFSWDGNLFYSASSDYSIRVWETRQAQQVLGKATDNVMVGHTDSITQIKAHKNQNIVASCGEDGLCKIWAVQKSKNPVLISNIWYNGAESCDTYRIDKKIPTSISWNSEESILIAYEDCTVALFATANANCIRRINTKQPFSNCLVTKTK